ncbi:MAG: type II secretion system protein GspM [Lachnospiraceae bacterium]|nr:type II secretion system protein GspM [Lachnospiraceae bacterium]
MTTKMTERDKKLLAGLGFVCVVGLLVFLVILPLLRSNADMQAQLDTFREQVAVMKEKEAQLPAVKSTNEKQKAELATYQDELYPMMKSQEIDRLLTDQVAAYGLTARRLQITMPEEAANVTGYGRTQDDGSNPDGRDGIWLAEVSLDVSGSLTNMDGFIDALSRDMPGIRVVNISWSSERRTVDAATGLSDTVDTMNMRLQVEMSREG